MKTVHTCSRVTTTVNVYRATVTLVKLLLSTLYRYFESGVCSVYLWDLDHGFAGVILIKKAGDTERTKGCWDSIHVVEVQVFCVDIVKVCNSHCCASHLKGTVAL